jgi:hypothetical protein
MGETSSMSDPAPTDLDLFVGLSAALTGVSSDLLAPFLDPINVKQSYFDTAQKSDPKLFAQLLQIYAPIQSQPPTQIADTILNQSGDAIRYLARAIMLEWYLGSWYAPADLAKPSPFIPFKVISSAAYTQGWAWRVAQSKPMGYSEWTFGYWSSPPPSLSDFVEG